MVDLYLYAVPHVRSFQLQLLETAIHQCIEFPAQHRYLSVFAQLCTHFVPGACHELCPEERTTIGALHYTVHCTVYSTPHPYAHAHAHARVPPSAPLVILSFVAYA